SVNFGVRYDRDDGVFDVLKTGVNRDFYEAVKAGNATRFQNTLPEDPDAISPRLGVVYRFDGEDENVVRGSYGVFHDKFITNLMFFPVSLLSPVADPGLPSSIACTDSGGAVIGCQAGFDFDGAGPLAPIPSDFSYQNWANDFAGNGPLKLWFDGIINSLGAATSVPIDIRGAPSPDWEFPEKKTLSIGWGHRFDSQWALDLNFVHSDGTNQPRFLDIRQDGVSTWNTGIDPSSGALREQFLVTDGKSEYNSLQGQVRGRTANLDLLVNVNLSRAEATQDLGASAGESGTQDIASGGNRRYTGANPADNPLCNTPGGPICVTEAAEWGPVSGDQFIWGSVYFAYRLPRGFTISGDASYGSEIAFWPFAGYDWNLDGITSGSEYVGQAGSGRGDDFFTIDLRAAKQFSVGKETSIDAFIEVFNLTDKVNYGLFVDQRQAGAGGAANPNFGQPTGNFLGEPRTFNLGARLRF
ncbi:MAG: hypothetical protein OEQ13_09570, partial [Acidobacteriota bacterium]|nr:hypothetical protein [Acidobacteriota bacterium]